MNRLYEAIALADLDEALSLCSILQCPEALASRKPLLKDRLEIFLGGRFGPSSEGGEVRYDKLCSRVASVLGASTSGSEVDIESHVVQHFVARFDSAVNAGERASFLEILAGYDRMHKTQLVQIFVAGGFVALFRSGGFGSYTAGSVVLSSLAGALGASLPFAAYTTLSTSLAAITGPIAWGVLGATAFGVLKKMNDIQFAPLIIWTHVVMRDRAYKRLELADNQR